MRSPTIPCGRARYGFRRPLAPSKLNQVTWTVALAGRFQTVIRCQPLFAVLTRYETQFGVRAQLRPDCGHCLELEVHHRMAVDVLHRHRVRGRAREVGEVPDVKADQEAGDHYGHRDEQELHPDPHRVPSYQEPCGLVPLMTDVSSRCHLQVIEQRCRFSREVGLRILVIEDEARIQSFLTRGLEAGGYTVVSAGDGREGLDLATRARWDLVVLDLLLPELNGLEVLRELHRVKPELPVVVLSARGDVQTKLRGFELGATDFLAKPFSLDELLARIRVRLPPRRDLRRRARPARRQRRPRRRATPGGRRRSNY